MPTNYQQGNEPRTPFQNPHQGDVLIEWNVGGSMTSRRLLTMRRVLPEAAQTLLLR